MKYLVMLVVAGLLVASCTKEEVLTPTSVEKDSTNIVIDEWEEDTTAVIIVEDF